MTTDQIVALAASIGACVSALAAFLAIREMAAQRQMTYRPELVPSRTSFVASPHPIARSFLPDHWLARSLTDDNAYTAPESTIKINNVGLGVAKNVRLVWQFDIAAAIEQINNLAQKTLSAAYFELKGDSLVIKSESEPSSTTIWGNQKTQAFDYIIPATSAQLPADARIPHAFRQVIAALIYFSYKEDKPQVTKYPVLNLAITYLDIAGAEHSAKYSFSVEPIIISGKGDFFEAYLNSVGRA
jgi:hypothetical protein